MAAHPRGGGRRIRQKGAQRAIKIGKAEPARVVAQRGEHHPRYAAGCDHDFEGADGGSPRHRPVGLRGIDGDQPVIEITAEVVIAVVEGLEA